MLKTILTILLVLGLISVAVCLPCCMLSSKLSREEEKLESENKN